MTVQPPAYFWSFAALSLLLHFMLPVGIFLFPPYTYAGFALIALGVTLNLWADRAFRKSGTTVKPHEIPKKLVTSGPFRLSRHPMYLGMTLALLGEALATGNLASFPFPFLFLAVMKLKFIPMEDSNLEKAFGPAYHDYKKKTHSWI